MNKIALVTGACGGIGQALVSSLIKEGYKLIVTGTNEDKLLDLEKQNGSENFLLLYKIDLTQLEEIPKLIKEIKRICSSIDVLINNAGNAFGLELFYEDDYNLMMKTIDLNLKAVMALTFYITKMMVRNNNGHIINMGSTAGQVAYLKGMAYCSSKAALKTLSDGMRLDLMDTNIKVTLIMPGLVKTDFSKVRLNNDEAADNVYKGIDALLPEDIANSCIYVLNQPKHVQIGEITLLATNQGNGFTLHKKE